MFNNYRMGYYTLSDGKRWENIAAGDEASAEQSLRRLHDDVDRVFSCSIETRPTMRAADDAKRCGGCGSVLLKNGDCPDGCFPF